MQNRKFSRILITLLAAATVFSSSAFALETVETSAVEAAPVAALADNGALGFDGTFETDVDTSIIEDNNAVLSVETDPTDPTNKALKVTADSAWICVNSYLTVEADTAYIVSYDIWADSEASPNGIGLTGSFRYDGDSVLNGSGNKFFMTGTTSAATTPDQKRHVENIFTVSDLQSVIGNTTLRLTIQSNNTAGIGTYWMDNISVVKYIEPGSAEDPNAGEVGTDVVGGGENGIPTYYFQDFEDAKLGVIDAKAAIGHFNPGTEHGGGGYTTTAEIKQEENGNKYLELVVPRYGGIAFAVRDDATALANAAFDVKVVGDVKPQFFSGNSDGANNNPVHQRHFTTSYTGGNLPTAWQSYSMNATKAVKAMGFYSANGVATIHIDNIYYYEIPEGSSAADIKVAVNLVNSTGAPEAEMPTYEVPFMTVADISKVKPADTATHKFAGWSLTDGGEVTTETSYLALEEKTFYAVWKQIEVPDMLAINSIRFGEKNGLRFAALINLPLANAETTEEYGFITTLKKLLDEKGLTAEDLVFDGEVAVAHGANYIKGSQAPIVYDTTGEAIKGVVEGTNQAITAVLTKIPAEGYKEAFVVRPYTKISGATYYGAAHTQSYWNAAVAVRASAAYETLSAEEKAQIDAAVTVGENLLVNGDAEDPNTGIFECYEFYDEGQTPNATFSIVYDEEKQSNVWLIESPKRNNWTYTNYPFSFVPGEIYVITLDVKCVGSPESDEDVALQLYFNAQLRGEKDNARHLVNLKKSEGWKTISFSITAPEADNFAFFSNPVSGNGVSYMFDNITCQVLQ